MKTKKAHKKQPVSRPRRIRCFVVKPGVNIGFGFDFTGLILEQFCVDQAEDPHIPDYMVLRQPPHDIHGKKCAEGGSVGISLEQLEEIKPIYRFSA